MKSVWRVRGRPSVLHNKYGTTAQNSYRYRHLRFIIVRGRNEQRGTGRYGGGGDISGTLVAYPFSSDFPTAPVRSDQTRERHPNRVTGHWAGFYFLAKACRSHNGGFCFRSERGRFVLCIQHVEVSRVRS